MKKLYKYIVLVIGILAFSACADEELVGSFGETGGDVTLKLNVQTQSNKNIVVSRATADENKLYDLHFYVFNAQEELTGYEKLVSATGDITSPWLDTNNDKIAEGIPVTIRTKTGASYIYALANIQQEDTYYLEKKKNADETVSDYDLLNVYNDATLQCDNNGNISQITTSKDGVNVTEDLKEKVASSRLTLSKLKSIQYQRVYGSETEWFSPTPQKKYVMSGYINDGNLVNIIEGDENTGTIQGANNGIIKLYRILAKNTLTIDWNESGGKFIPKYYKLCSVPTCGLLVPNANFSTVYNTEDQYLTQTNYTELQELDINVVSDFRENFKLTNDVEKNKKIELTFHYPENIRSYGINDNIKKWKDREKNSWEASEKTFVNAPTKAAYIELYGDYVDSSGNLTANVSYTIHLGNFSSSGNLSDFNVVRNHNYKYNVSIKGVDDIITEAQLEDDASTELHNHYAEGLVINASDGEHYEVDAHYEARVMEFSKSSIIGLKSVNDNAGNGYIINISTPFGKTPETLMVKQITRDDQKIAQICDLLGNELAIVKPDGTLQKVQGKTVFGIDDEEDYNWMKFVKNTSGNKPDYASSTDPISKYPCKYPGDQWNKKTHSESMENNKPNQRWLNVFELLAELYYTDDDSEIDNINTDDDVYGTSGKVYYTCFIDEYYYNDKVWSSYVNQSRRTMQIANNLYISSDKKSIYAEVAYSISQRSISSFYTNGSVNAFGTENIDEEFKYNSRLDDSNGDLYYSDIDVDNQVVDDWSARTSAVAENNSKAWYNNETVSVSLWEGSNQRGFSERDRSRDRNIVKIEKSQPLYKSVAKACMSRNRDLNGNSIIDTEEVRWYLASIGQYRALFLGQSALEEDVRLISTSELETINGSSEMNDGYGFPFRSNYHYWTSSDQRYSGTFWPEEGLTNNPVQTSGYLCRAELVRCIRTLQSNGDGLKEAEPFFNYTGVETRTFTLNGIVVTRPPGPNALGVHTEIDNSNDFSTSFQVAKYNLSNTYNSSSIWNLSPNDDPCKNYKKQNNVINTEEANYDWSMPNQKELALMVSIPELAEWKDEEYLSTTKYSGTWHNSNKQRTYSVFGSDNGSINLTQLTGAYIRCVRDVFNQ